jgi:hypothetical protein
MENDGRGIYSGETETGKFTYWDQLFVMHQTN